MATSESRIIAFSLEYIERRLENMICTSDGVSARQPLLEDVVVQETAG